MLRYVCSVFGITEKEFMSDWRMGVRELWAQSTIKRSYHDSCYVMVENTNPRSMKRFPMVKRWECSICKGLFTKAETELDHVLGENKCTSFEDAAEFLQSIAIPREKESLQILCKSCHEIKTYAERYKYTFEEAKVRKNYIKIRNSEKDLIGKLKAFGIKEIPKTKIAKQKLVLSLMLKEIGVIYEEN